MSEAAALVARDAKAFFRQRGSIPCLSALRVLPLPWAGRAEAFAAAAHAKGLSATAKGEDGFGLSPPLTITEDEIARAVAALARALGPDERQA